MSVPVIGLRGASGSARRPPGMHDVARLAGVSHQTVSRVLNHHPNVRPDTRDRVMAAIGQLGYRRNIAARALVTRRSNTIGVVTSGSTLWGPSSALVAVEIAARTAGYYVSVASLRGGEPFEMRDVMEHFVDQSVDGIIVIAPEAALAQVAEPYVSRVPVVVVAAGAPPSPGVHVTGVDQLHGSRLAVRHLLDLGHRSIAHITGPAGWFDAAARTRGWRAELRRAGMPAARPHVGDWTATSGYDAGRAMLAGGLPTAVFAANDLMALGLMRAMHDAGVEVPQQVSVVGFDDIPGAAHFIPALTTVRQDFQALGRQCIEVLFSAFDGDAADTALMKPELIIRESAGPISAAAAGHPSRGRT